MDDEAGREFQRRAEQTLQLPRLVRQLVDELGQHVEWQRVESVTQHRGVDVDDQPLGHAGRLVTADVPVRFRGRDRHAELVQYLSGIVGQPGQRHPLAWRGDAAGTGRELLTLSKVKDWTSNGLHTGMAVGAKRTSPCVAFIQLNNRKWRKISPNDYLCGPLIDTGVGG